MSAVPEDRVDYWRPVNETPEDLAREDAARKLIEDAWGCRITKVSEMLYGVDWAVHRVTRVVGWGEYKWRAKRYDTLILSFAKYMKLRNLTRYSGMPSTIFVEWPKDGGLHYYPFEPKDAPPVVMTGNARGQNGDIEPCIEIPTKLFKRVRKLGLGEAA